MLLTNELRERSEGSALGREAMTRSFTNGFGNTGYDSLNNSMNSDLQGMKSVNGRVPIKYVTGYPAFLTPFKQYPYRRLNDTHIENVMQSAVKRYEEDLRKVEKERRADQQRFQEQLKENDNYLEELEIKKKKIQVENKRMLLEQMQRENYARLKSKIEAKEKVNTNFGPEENDATLNMRKSFQKRNVKDIKKCLEKQMLERYQLNEQEKLQERIEELETIKKAKELMEKEEEELKVKDKNAKNIYKEAWKEQMKMKEIQKKTDNLFKN